MVRGVWARVAAAGPPAHPSGRHNGVVAAAMRRIGELTMENELLRAKMERVPGPLARRRRR